MKMSSLFYVAFIFFSFSCAQEDANRVETSVKENKEQKVYQDNMGSNGILKELDGIISNQHHEFVNLEDALVVPASSRLSLYADTLGKWLILFELSGYHPRMNQLVSEITGYGNALSGLEAPLYSSYVELMEKNYLQKISGEPECIGDNIDKIAINGSIYDVPRSPQVYKNLSIPNYDETYQSIDFSAVFRYITSLNANALMLSEEQKEPFLAEGLNLIMYIDEWYQEEYFVYGNKVYGVPPSQYETYQLISKVLENQDSSYWKPTLPANNHWRNWPHAGEM